MDKFFLISPLFSLFTLFRFAVAANEMMSDAGEPDMFESCFFSGVVLYLLESHASGFRGRLRILYF